VLNQTHSDFEVVVIDDGSSDGSVNLVNEYIDDRITLLRQKNQGVSVARNLGIGKSRSDYVALMDADDQWLPNHLENLLHLVQQYPDANMWVSGYRKSTQKKGSFCKPNRKFNLESYLDHTLNNISIAWTSAVLLNVSKFRETDGFMARISHGEDKAFWLEMCLNGYIAKSFLETAIYNIYDNTLSKKLVSSGAECACMIYIMNVITSNKSLSAQIKQKLMETRCRYALAHAIGALRCGKPSVVREFLAESHITRIYRKKRRLIKILWFISLWFPNLVARFFILIGRFK